MNAGAPRKRSDEAYERLKRSIITGEFGSGEILAERELAAQLGMSRTPLREALMNLVRDGLVVLLPNRGFIVNAASPREINETFDLRYCLERYVVEQVFDRGLRISTDGLRDAAGQQQAAWRVSDTWEFFEANRRFHIELVKILGNRKMVEVLEAQTHQMMQSGYRALREQATLEEAMQEHEEIIRALDAGDKQRTLRAIGEHCAKSKLRQHADE